jgi:hypothetical protein
MPHAGQRAEKPAANGVTSWRDLAESGGERASHPNVLADAVASSLPPA